MHDIKWISEHPADFDAALVRRGLLPEAKRLTEIDERRRVAIQRLETMQARRNVASKEIGAAKRSNEEATAQALVAEVARLKAAMPALEAEEKRISKELEIALAQIPNLPLSDVPDGNDSADNVLHHHFGAKRPYEFQPRQHFELGEALGQMDFETAAKLSGARFVLLRSSLARLERALGQFMVDLHTGEHGYTEISPPILVRDEAMFGTAQLPKFRDDQFISAEMKWREARLNEVLQPLDEEIARRGESARRVVHELLENAETVEEFWLIPTAEVPLTNIVRDAILNEVELPLRFTACTPCFRAEAGAAGKDTRGMIRQHQFTKVELVSITTPEQSEDEQERMLSSAEEVLRRLDLHYRVVTLCAGDMGFAAQKTYDIEVWLPGQNAYREISSCSRCGEFQARRMNARFRAKDKRQVRHVHTLNGSGVAVGRALIAVMETCQQEDGSIAVPGVLQPYMGGAKSIEFGRMPGQH